jgi:ketosteroid isomerase-like protein
MRRWLGSKRYLLLGVAALAATCFALPCPAEHHERKKVERTEILKLEEKWRAAQLAEDISAMDRLLSDQYLGITAAGQVVTKLQQLERMRTRRLDIRQMTLSDTKIKISGRLAVVTSLAEIDGMADGAPLKGAFRYTRVYQRDAGEGWKITNFEATHVGRRAGAAPGTPQASSAVPSVAAPSSLPASPAGSSSPLPQS